MDTIYVQYVTDEKKRNDGSVNHAGKELTPGQFVLDSAKELHNHVSRKVPAAAVAKDQGELEYEKIVVIKVRTRIIFSQF